MNVVSNAEMCLSFRRLADWTWQNMGDAHRLKVSLNEETITEYILLQLARQFSGRGLEIESYTKYQEGTSYRGGLPTNADWEFWFEDGSARGIRVRIQAKRLFPETGKYNSLNGNGPQIKKLVQNASGAIPLFVLYNCDPTSLLTFQNMAFYEQDPRCCGWPFFVDELWGCSIATPQAIPPKNQPSPFEVEQLPWHALVCGCFSGRSPKPIGSLPDVIAANLKRLYSGRSGDGRKSRPRAERFAGLSDITFEPNNQQPDWVGRLKEGRSDFKLPEGLGGVVVVTDRRDRK